MNPRLVTLTKEAFPGLLRRAIEKMTASTVRAGFRKCGIYPISREQVICQLPGQNSAETAQVDKEKVATSLVEFLRERRFGGAQMEVGESSTAPKRGKKLAVEPGKSVSLEEAIAKESKEPKKVAKKRG